MLKPICKSVNNRDRRFPIGQSEATELRLRPTKAVKRRRCDRKKQTQVKLELGRWRTIRLEYERRWLAKNDVRGRGL